MSGDLSPAQGVQGASCAARVRCFISTSTVSRLVHGLDHCVCRGLLHKRLPSSLVRFSRKVTCMRLCGRGRTYRRKHDLQALACARSLLTASLSSLSLSRTTPHTRKGYAKTRRGVPTRDRARANYRGSLVVDTRYGRCWIYSMANTSKSCTSESPPHAVCPSHVLPPPTTTTTANTPLIQQHSTRRLTMRR